MNDCDQELCPNWGGDECLCRVFDIERPEKTCDDCGRRHVREDCPTRWGLENFPRRWLM